jgi:hypothetical protein
MQGMVGGVVRDLVAAFLLPEVERRQLQVKGEHTASLLIDVMYLVNSLMLAFCVCS